MALVGKMMSVLRSENRGQRILLALNKSPLRHLSRALVDAANHRLLARRRDALRRMTLSPAEAQAVAELREKGYAEVTALVDPALPRAMEQDVLRRMQHKDEAAAHQRDTGKNFWLRLLDQEIERAGLDTDSVYLRLPLQESLIRTVGGYLGELPFLTYVLLTVSEHTPGPLQKSQLWHLDRDDTRMLKLFVYLTDVETIDDGPFTLYDRPTSKRARMGFFGRHLKDDEIAASVGNAPPVRFVRPKYSVFLVDTSVCVHMGSRLAPGHARIMYTALYGAYPAIYREVRNKFRPLPGASALERAVVAPWETAAP